MTTETPEEARARREDAARADWDIYTGDAEWSEFRFVHSLGAEYEATVAARQEREWWSRLVGKVLRGELPKDLAEGLAALRMRQVSMMDAAGLHEDKEEQADKEGETDD